MDMREHRLGYRETARKYNLTVMSESSAANMVQRWERIYLEEGAEGLMKERRGRAFKIAFQHCKMRCVGCKLRNKQKIKP